MKQIAVLFCLTFSTVAVGQTNALIDSLDAVLKIQKEDSNKVKTLNELAWEYSSVNLKKGEAYCRTSIALATHLNFIRGRSSAYNTLGNITSDEGDNKEALSFYLLAAKDKEFIKDEKGAATIYSNIGILYRTAADSGNALKYNRLALEKRERLHDQLGISDSYNNMGNIYRDFARYEEALDMYAKALKIRLEAGDKRRIAFTYNNLATVYDDRSDFIRALDCNYKASKLLEEIKDNNSLTRVYNNIGIINKKLKNYPDALRYSQLALGLSEKTGNKSYRISIYENLGGLYVEKKDYNMARSMYEKGMVLADTAGDKEMQAHFYSGLGICYENQHDLGKAEASLKHAIDLVLKSKSDRDQVRYSNNLADFWCREHRNEDVEPLLSKCIYLAKKNNYPDELKKSYKISAEYYQNVKMDQAKSNIYYKLYCSLNDSLFPEDLGRKFAEQQTNFETEKKERDIRILTQQGEIKSLHLADQLMQLEKRNYMLLGSGAFILLLFLTGYIYFSRQRIQAAVRQQAAVLDAEEKERMRMAKDIHDDLGSGLSKIKFLTEIVLSKAGADSEIRSGITSISEKAVFLVDNMRDLIWALNPENNTLESLIVRIREYSSDYLNDFPVDLVMNIQEDVGHTRITKEAHRNIFFILKECMQNIVKHAAASEVVLKIEASLGKFILSVSDNGKGFHSSVGVGGNGLLNIRQRAEAIGGAAEITTGEAGKGVVVSIHVQLVKIKIDALI
jgi:signal transduction histidine kinase